MDGVSVFTSQLLVQPDSVDAKAERVARPCVNMKDPPS